MYTCTFIYVLQHPSKFYYIMIKLHAGNQNFIEQNNILLYNILLSNILRIKTIFNSIKKKLRLKIMNSGKTKV